MLLVVIDERHLALNVDRQLSWYACACASILIASIFLVTFTPCRAGDKGAHQAAPRLSEPSREPFELLTKRVLRSNPQPATVYQLGSEPLGNRRPMLLIPGLKGEYWPLSRWHKIRAKFVEKPDFHSTYKIYMLRYDSRTRLHQIVPQFRQAILALSDRSGKKPITVLALSLGGNIVWESMADARVDTSIQVVMTMGAPFHGSPLFCRDWWVYSLLKNVSWPWTAADHNLIYRLYFRRFPNLPQDFCWNNCDGAMPSPGSFRSLAPFGPSGKLVAADSTNRYLPAPRSHLSKKKLITYAGYLPTPYLNSGIRRRAELLGMAPWRYITSTVPVHLGHERAALRILNREMSRMVLHPSVRKRSGTRYLYALNDGVAPVNSAIFLPPAACKKVSIARHEDIPKLRPFVDVQLARVLRDVDHLSFIDNKRLSRDELHPEAGKRTLVDWIVRDMMRPVGQEKLAQSMHASH